MNASTFQEFFEFHGLMILILFILVDDVEPHVDARGEVVLVPAQVHALLRSPDVMHLPDVLEYLPMKIFIVSVTCGFQTFSAEDNATSKVTEKLVPGNSIS